MRSIALAIILLLGATTAAMAQDSPRGDAALTYQWVRTNATPGNCGCFSMNGGGASVSYNLSSRLAAVAEFSADSASNVFSQGKSLTVTSFMAGARYRLLPQLARRPHRIEPFVQLLVGAAHAGGGIAGRADGAYAFASRVGGGIDLPVTSRIAVRLIQVDYFFTHFTNFTNDHQNNLLLGAGVVFRW